MSAERRIVWGVDLAPGDARGVRAAAAFLRAWTAGTGLAVEPVYVAGAAEQAPPSAAARAAGFMPLKTLAGEGASQAARADSLLDYAERTRAVAVALATRERGALARLALGSFADHALRRSRLPLLLVPPRVKTVVLRSITFPTDLSAASRATFRLVLLEARLRRLPLSLIHVPRFDLEHGEAAYGPPRGYAAVKESYLAGHRALLEGWAAEARSSGVDAEAVLLPETGDLAGALVDFAKRRRASLIAMATSRGPVEAALGGSVTRQVVRAASCPVWALHVEKR